MPTYEYQCSDCDRNFDVVQSFSDDALTECPTCHGPVRKVFGSVGIVFKGSGFYKTDSRSGSSSSAAASTASSDSAPAPATTAPSGSETPAAKSESTATTASPGSSSNGSTGKPAAATTP